MHYCPVVRKTSWLSFRSLSNVPVADSLLDVSFPLAPGSSSLLVPYICRGLNIINVLMPGGRKPPGFISRLMPYC